MIWPLVIAFTTPFVKTLKPYLSVTLLCFLRLAFLFFCCCCWFVSTRNTLLTFDHLKSCFSYRCQFSCQILLSAFFDPLRSFCLFVLKHHRIFHMQQSTCLFALLTLLAMSLAMAWILFGLTKIHIKIWLPMW